MIYLSSIKQSLQGAFSNWRSSLTNATRIKTITPKTWIITLGSIGAATLLMLAERDELGVLNVSLIYLLLVLVVALLAGSTPASVTAIVCFLLFDVLFIPPYGTLTVAQADHVLSLFVFLGVAIVTGQLVAHVKAKTEIAIREQRRTQLLYELNAALVADFRLEAVLGRIVEQVVRVYGARSCLLLQPGESGVLAVSANFPGNEPVSLDRQRLAIAEWVVEHRAPAGLGAAGRKIHGPHIAGRASRNVTRREDDLLCLPVATTDQVIAVLEVTGRPGGGRFNRDDEQLLVNFANQAALALERTRLSEEAARVSVLAASDELKSALMSAVSHDLRTPLASIKTSVTALLDDSVDWEASARQEMLEAVNEETDRLTLMVANLLDLSRIEGGALRPDREWYDASELIGDVARRSRGRLGDHLMDIEVEHDLPSLYFDYVEIAQVLTNLIENAVKYAPPGTRIVVGARAVIGAVEFRVHDDGPGIPRAAQARLFEKFFRVEEKGRVPGTGIGLTISRGLVEAHGGRIWIESGPGIGTSVTFTIPIQERPDSGG